MGVPISVLVKHLKVGSSKWDWSYHFISSQRCCCWWPGLEHANQSLLMGRRRVVLKQVYLIIPAFTPFYSVLALPLLVPRCGLQNTPKPCVPGCTCSTGDDFAHSSTATLQEKRWDDDQDPESLRLSPILQWSEIKSLDCTNGLSLCRQGTATASRAQSTSVLTWAYSTLQGGGKSIL